MKYFLLPILIILFSGQLFSQKKKKRSAKNSTEISFDQKDFKGMSYRNIGPFRGGRSTAVTGVIQNTDTYYFGSTGGGVWKTVDGGHSWNNISDGYFKTGSVGAIAVAPSDQNVIYVGMGEAPIRGVMTSHGDGVYKSTDGGQSWSHVGLPKTRHISDIRIHPQNPDVVFVSAQGSPYIPTADRGIYKSTDGGANWKKVLFVDQSSGACDLSIDMNNPRVLYAAIWDHQRLPYTMRSGGEGGGIWKSSDEGETWTELTNGLPTEIMGKIGVVVSPANSQRVYAIIEAKKGGLFRSDDAGKNWKLINEDRVLRARSWYYMHIFADPKDEDKLVILNAPYMESTDGGKSFSRRMTPHGDNHDLWIHPDNPDIMINGNDGGANISYNGGKTWSTQQNQPTAQFYRVNADNQFPYHVYGGQQDNSTVATPSTWTGAGIPYDAFYRVGGCESAFTAFDPDNPRIVYAGCYQGIISKYDTKLKTGKDVMAYPDLGLGQKSGDLKYRYNWNAPIVLSRHDKKTLFHTAQVVLKSTDEGITWEEISPELTRNVPEELGWGGGPITNEAAGGENYHTIQSLAESPHQASELWVGTDDGLIQMTNDAGKNWKNVTPTFLKEGMINSLEVSEHDPLTVYAAFTRYKFNDFTPHVLVTKDGGQNWQGLSAGIGPEAHVRVVREDPEVPGLLYAGTETGIYISLNGGHDWDSLQMNLPVVPVTDLKVHHGDLVVATAGRAFWIFDDLTPIRSFAQNKNLAKMELLMPREANLWGGRRAKTSTSLGTNKDPGLSVFYRVPADTSIKEVCIKIKEKDGRIVRTFHPTAKEKEDKLKFEPGLNKFVYDLKRQKYKGPKGVMTFGGTDAAHLTPGTYDVALFIGDDSMTQTFVVADDPRLEIPPSAYAEKAKILAKIDETTKALFGMVNDLRDVRTQVNEFKSRDQIKKDTLLEMKCTEIVKEIDSLESRMIQVKQKTFQDVINFPNQLDAQLMHIQSIIDGAAPPITNGQKNRVADLIEKWEAVRETANGKVYLPLQDLNEMIKKSAVPFIETKHKVPGRS